LISEGAVSKEKIVIMDYYDTNEHKSFSLLSKPLNSEELLLKIGSRLGMESALKIIQERKIEQLKKIKRRSGISKYNILLAEDNETNQKMAVKILEKIGFKNIDIASNGREAVELYSERRYAVILMDCQMPEMSGFEATEKIRKYELEYLISRTPIIAMTAGVSDGSREKCISFGMDEYIGKPFKVENLERIIFKYISVEEEEINLEAEKDGVSEEGVYGKIMKLTGISEKDIEEIIEDFVQRVPQNIMELKNAIESKNFEKVAEISHNFKGVLRNLCFDEAAEIAQQLEKSSYETNEAVISVLSRKLIESIEVIIERIKNGDL